MADIPKKVIDQLLANYEGPEDLLGPDGLLKQLSAALVERAMEAEVTEHLGYDKHDLGIARPTSPTISSRFGN